MSPDQEQGKNKYPDAHEGAPRDPKQLMQNLQDALGILESAAEPSSSDTRPPKTNIEKLRALLAAKEDPDADVDIDELNRLRALVQQEPIQPEEE